MQKVLFHPFPLAFLFVAIGSAIFGQTALSVLALVASLASVAFLSVRESRSLRDEGVMEDLSNEERAQLGPLRKLRNEIAQIVEAKNEDISIAVVGKEAIQEADHILEQCAKLVHLRKELRRGLFSQAESSKQIQSLQTELAAASDDQKKTLEDALNARKLEESHYGDSAKSLEQIDAKLKQAEAALSEMRARLATASSATAGTEPASELEDTIGRLKSLGGSLDEAEDFLKGQA
jgi:chromosome segregation ATPase